MCKHKYKVKFYKSSNQCGLSDYYSRNKQKFIDQSLLYDSDGFCLFHSQNWEWKKEHHFEAKTLELLNIMLEDREVKSVDFRGFHFIPDSKEQISWTGITTTKAINLSGAHFKGGFSLINNQFSDDFYMDVAEIEGVFSIEDCIFTKSFTAIQKTQFHGNVYFQNVVFHDLFDLNNSRFFSQIHCSDVTFNGYTVWDNVINKTKQYAFAYFRIKTTGYTSFKATEFHSPVQFEQCIFEGDTHFIETRFKKALHFNRPQLKANVHFKGLSEDDLIFEDEVEMSLMNADFEGAAQLVFEFANLVALDKNTKNKLAELKANRHVVLGQGTIVFRISFAKTYPYSELGEIFIQDLLTTIKQYFKKNLNKHFEFVFTKEGEDLKVTFYTDDYIRIEDFQQDKNNTVKSLISEIDKPVEDTVSKYLQEKFKDQLSAALQATVKNDLAPIILERLLESENLNLILQTDNIDSMYAERLSIGSIQNGQFYINRLEGLENQPEFKLSLSQFESLKNQLSNITEETRWQELITLLESIKNDIKAKDELIPFLGECGVSIANNISASVIFVILNQLLMR